MSFESLGLSPELLRALAEQNYTTPTPIQQQAIPLALEGRLCNEIDNPEDLAAVSARFLQTLAQENR